MFWIGNDSRAVRLEVLDRMSTESLIEALLSIWQKTGYPYYVWCDNGRNFIGLNNKLIELHEKGAISEVVWRLSTPYSPWQNGTSERLVRTTKECLAFLPSKCKSLFELSRKFNQIETVINSRPIL